MELPLTFLEIIWQHVENTSAFRFWDRTISLPDLILGNNKTKNKYSYIRIFMVIFNYEKKMGMMVNFMSTWLDHGVPRYFAEHYLGCVHEGI